MMALDHRPRMSAIARALGVAATVTRPAPDDTPIDTVGIWVPLDSVKVPEGSAWGREEPLRCLAFDVDEVPTCPRQTLIVAPERKGGPALTWIVDGLADMHAIDADQVKAIVRPHPAIT